MRLYVCLCAHMHRCTCVHKYTCAVVWEFGPGEEGEDQCALCALEFLEGMVENSAYSSPENISSEKLSRLVYSNRSCYKNGRLFLEIL